MAITTKNAGPRGADDANRKTADPKGGASKDKPKTPSAKPAAKVPGPKAAGGKK